MSRTPGARRPYGERVRYEWIPASAAFLVTGALAYALGILMLPSTTESAAAAIRVVEQADERWLAVALISFIASVMLTLGLPSALTLVDLRHRRLGMASAVVLGAGFIGIAGYAMLLAAFRALVVTGALTAAELERTGDERGVQVLLAVWTSCFVVGELLLALALLLPRRVSRVVPGLLLVHAVVTALGDALPEPAGKAAALAFAAAFSAIGIRAAAPQRPR